MMNCDARLGTKQEARLTFAEAAEHCESLSASCSPTAMDKPVCHLLEGAGEDGYVILRS